MKLSHNSFLKTCEQPLRSLRSLLFYGDSEFWVQLKFDYFIENNPSLKGFRSRIISQDTILENKDTFSQLFFVKDFFRGPEILIIAQATDRITPFVEDLLNSQSASFFIIKALDYLRPSSKLRKVYETHPYVGSMPCYEESSSNLLEKKIDSFFKHHGKKISPDLSQRLGKFFFSCPDTLHTELEKVLAYIGSKETIETEDLKGLVSIPSQTDYNDLVNSFLDKNKKKVIHSLDSFSDGALYISILRSLSLNLTRLHQAKFPLDKRISFEESTKQLKPPLLFNEVESFKKRLSIWSVQEIEVTLKKLLETETSIKRNSKVSKEIFEFFFLDCPI